MCAITFDWKNNNAHLKFNEFKKEMRLHWGVIELTSYCNFKCKWCFANSGVAGYHMPLEDVKTIIDYFKQNAIKQITFSGGEPLLYPHLKEVIDYASKLGFIVHMNTNGSLLTLELAKELKVLGLSQIETNIDSIHPDEHDFIRGFTGSYQKAIQAIKNAKYAGINVVMQTVLTRLNEKDIKDIFLLAHSLDVERSRIWDVTPSEGCARDNMNTMNLLPENNYIDIVLDLVSFAKNYDVKNIESSDPLFPLKHNLDVPITGGYCVFENGLVINVSTDGDVFSCCTDRIPIYNLFEIIGNINIDLNEYHRQRLISQNEKTVHNDCMSCDYYSLCKGGCMTRRRYSGENSDYWCDLLATS